MGRILDISDVLLELGITSSETDVERSVVGSSITRAESAIRRHLKYDPAQASRTEYYPQADSNLGRSPTVWEVENQQAVLRRRSTSATDQLQLLHLPVRASPAIDLRIDFDGRSGTKSSSFGSETQKTEGDDFWPNYDAIDSSGVKLCRDGILRSVGLWPTTAGSVKVVYTAGYTRAELTGQDTVVDATPIFEAALIEASRRAKAAFLKAKKTGVGFTPGSVVSEKLGDYSYQIGGGSEVDRQFGGIYDLLPQTREMLSDFVNMGAMIFS